MQPVRRALGALLLEQGRVEEAESVYREDLGLLPPLRDRPTGRGQPHRQFTDEDVAAICAGVLAAVEAVAPG